MELDYTNNEASKDIFIQGAPDIEKPVIISATANPTTIVADGINASMLNVTATDNIGVTSVVVNLSSIGGSPTQPMSYNDGVWQYETTVAPRTPSGTYYLQVTACDAAENYNDSVSIELNVTADIMAPIISNVSVTNITLNSATITWDTNELGNSLVKHGEESESYTQQEYDPANVTSHSVNLIGLLPNTTYYFVVNSTDQSGNSNESPEHSFTTLSRYTKKDVGVTSTISLASPSDLLPYLPPEYTDTDISDAVVFNVEVTDNTLGDPTDDAYTDITIKVGELDIETCKVFKTGIGFLPEVDDVATLPTLKPLGDPAFSRDLVNKTVTVRLYVGDPLLGVIPPALPFVFDTGPGTYPSLMGTHNGTIIPSVNITVNKMYTYPCAGTGGHTESIEISENGELIANSSWNGYQGDWHNITIHNVTGAPYVTLLKGHKYNYTIITGSYPQIIHEPSKEVTGGTITCTSFIDANGKVYNDWIPAIKFF